MGLILTVPPAAEPLSVAEVMAHLRQDFSNQEPAPGAPLAALASPAAPGNVDNGAHRYLVVFVTAAGKTQAGAPSAAVTVADKTVNGKVALSGIPVGSSAVTARELYRTVAGGNTYLHLATIADNVTTTYLDNIADASLGAGAPAANTTSDPQLSALIVAARRLAEHLTGRALVTQQWRLTLDRFPAGEIELPLPPLVSIETITYRDTAGVEQTLDPAAYAVYTSALFGRVAPAYGTAWPATRDVRDAVAIDFTAGYGAPSAVPQDIKHWMKICMGGWDAYREQIVTGLDVNELPRGMWDVLLDAYRVWRLV